MRQKNSETYAWKGQQNSELETAPETGKAHRRQRIVHQQRRPRRPQGIGGRVASSRQQRSKHGVSEHTDVGGMSSSSMGSIGGGGITGVPSASK